ncbi:MFS transporter [Odoribacter sp. OttesenSCG-928-J03]|nr:MFS transporter [Odoribacter sp. OttesenSCG-928-J03]MDL2283226.1 MFS transporter [Odoribacter sp. OttesenSCG-928-G04]MDL2331260.1 MFS transporter [Odoribacter sp. OttesenSCG-928-A06]
MMAYSNKADEQQLMGGVKAEKGTKRYNRIRNCIFISGLSVFAQLYLFQPMLADLCVDFAISPAMSSLAVSVSTVGMAVGLLIFAFKADSVSREKLMGFTLLLSSLLTILSAFVWDFPSLLVVNFLKGVVLSGVSAVALAYLTEEVSASVIGLAISLYLSGNTIGGMSGRVVAILVSGWSDWRWAAVVIGFVSLFLGFLFVRHIPHSEHFRPRRTDIREKLGNMATFIRTPLFLGMYFVAALIMGAFVSVYNYLSFVLESPKFGLPHYVVALIFMMYTAGVGGSLITGRLSDRRSPVMLLNLSILLMLGGLIMLMIMQLWAIIVGLGMMTFAFFSAHTMASRIVSMTARTAKSSATCLYWLFYYIGSSVTGSLTGVVLTQHGWHSFLWVIVGLTVVAFVIGVTTTRRI